MARHIHLHFGDAGDFDEAKHKRAGNGQFGSGGGGAAKPAAKTAPAHGSPAQKALLKSATEKAQAHAASPAGQGESRLLRQAMGGKPYAKPAAKTAAKSGPDKAEDQKEIDEYKARLAKNPKDKEAKLMLESAEHDFKKNHGAAAKTAAAPAAKSPAKAGVPYGKADPETKAAIEQFHKKLGGAGELYPSTTMKDLQELSQKQQLAKTLGLKAPKSEGAAIGKLAAGALDRLAKPEDLDAKKEAEAAAKKLGSK